MFCGLNRSHSQPKNEARDKKHTKARNFRCWLKSYIVYPMDFTRILLLSSQCLLCGRRNFPKSKYLNSTQWNEKIPFVQFVSEHWNSSLSSIQLALRFFMPRGHQDPATKHFYLVQLHSTKELSQEKKTKFLVCESTSNQKTTAHRKKVQQKLNYFSLISRSSSCFGLGSRRLHSSCERDNSDVVVSTRFYCVLATMMSMAGTMQKKSINHRQQRSLKNFSTLLLKVLGMLTNSTMKFIFHREARAWFWW